MGARETGRNKVSFWTKLKNFPQVSIALALIVIFVIFSIGTESFLTPGNIVNMLRQTSTNMIIAIGMTFILILGGIDLSVGSLACLAAIFTSSLMTGSTGAGKTIGEPMPLVLALLIGIVLAAAFGLINGIVVTKLKLPPFIVTMATMSTARGVALVYTGGYPVSALPESATNIGRGEIANIPYTVILMLIILIIAWILLDTTKFGRYVYAIGGNEECARLSGIKVNRVKVLVYVLSGALAGIAGILVAFRMATAQPSLGEGYELDAITAVALGGTSLAGGRGYMQGTVLGCLFLSFLSTGFNIMGVNSYWQQIFKGIILIIAISLYLGKKKVK